jgi:hypothetical protein
MTTDTSLRVGHTHLLVWLPAVVVAVSMLVPVTYLGVAASQLPGHRILEIVTEPSTLRLAGRTLGVQRIFQDHHRGGPGHPPAREEGRVPGGPARLDGDEVGVHAAHGRPAVAHPLAPRGLDQAARAVAARIGEDAAAGRLVDGLVLAAPSGAGKTSIARRRRCWSTACSCDLKLPGRFGKTDDHIRSVGDFGSVCYTHARHI